MGEKKSATTSRKKEPRPKRDAQAKTPARASKAVDVDAFLTGTAHPLLDEIHVARRAIARAAPDITEHIKWNAVSFRNPVDFFATVNLRSAASLELVLYTGVRVKKSAVTGVSVDDPHGLILKWPAKDRCILSLGTGPDVTRRAGALTALVKAWLPFVREA